LLADDRAIVFDEETTAFAVASSASAMRLLRAPRSIAS
jgi:hypothetical protein